MTTDGGRALVLGGGGVAGIAWEAGLITGLAEQGVDLAAADLIVGTSAGSVVGTFLAHGADLRAEIAVLADPPPGAQRPPSARPDLTLAMEAFAILYDTTLDPVEARARVGRMALEAPTDGAGASLEALAERLPSREWPDRPLLVTGVDTADGTFVVWDRDGDAPLDLAVRASCSVPCVYPPVTIGGRRFMDGGARSITNADLAKGADAVVVLEPMGYLSPRETLERELKELDGARTAVIGPDKATIETFGTDLLNMRLWGPAFAAGLAQAETAAPVVHEVWNAA